MNIKPIGSISILDVSESEIPAVLVAWILAFNVEWLDVNNEEHIINPYTEVSEINLNRIEDRNKPTTIYIPSTIITFLLNALRQ